MRYCIAARLTTVHATSWLTRRYPPSKSVRSSHPGRRILLPRHRTRAERIAGLAPPGNGRRWAMVREVSGKHSGTGLRETQATIGRLGPAPGQPPVRSRYHHGLPTVSIFEALPASGFAGAPPPSYGGPCAVPATLLCSLLYSLFGTKTRAPRGVPRR